MILVRTAVLTFVLLHCAVALQSQFARKINFDQLEEQYADPEDEDWHEDSLDWKEKMAEHSAPRVDSFDPSDPEGFVRSAGGQGGLQVKYGRSAAAACIYLSQMAFATLRKKYVKTKVDAELLANKWQGEARDSYLKVPCLRDVSRTAGNGTCSGIGVCSGRAGNPFYRWVYILKQCA